MSSWRSILSVHYSHQQFWGWSKWLQLLHELENRGLQVLYRFRREWYWWKGTKGCENTRLQEWQWLCTNDEPYDICIEKADERPNALRRKRDLQRSEGWWNAAAFGGRKVKGTCPSRIRILSLCWEVVKQERQSKYEELLFLYFSKEALAIFRDFLTKAKVSTLTTNYIFVYSILLEELYLPGIHKIHEAIEK